MNIRKLEEILEEKQMSYYRLAKMLNVKTSYMTKLKKGIIASPSFEIVCKIADVLDVDVNVFRERRA